MRLTNGGLLALMMIAALWFGCATTTEADCKDIAKGALQTMRGIAKSTLSDAEKEAQWDKYTRIAEAIAPAGCALPEWKGEED